MPLPEPLTRGVFVVIVALLALQRIFELRRSARHERSLLESGGREHSAGHFPWMRWMHTLWFPAMLAEVFLLERIFDPKIAGPALAGLLLGQWLRLAAIRTLGQRWTVRILTPAQGQRITSGPYRWVRHPNYLGVILEIASVPLLHTAWLTASAFSLLNLAVLAVRIRAEERALGS